MTTELWTPPGVTDHSVSPVGRNTETGGDIQQHTFKVHDPVTGKRHKFCVLVDNETSQAHLEDMVSSAVDRWITEVRQKDHKPAPTTEQRKESSNGRIYYSGLEGGQNGRYRDSG